MRKSITSAQNPQIKDLVRLQSSRRERLERGAFLTEGVKLCSEAMRSGLTGLELLYTQKALEKHPQILSSLMEWAGESTLITPEISAKISDAPTPQGVFVRCKMLDNHLDLAKIRRDGRYLLANAIQDPGNLGTIIRSADAFEVDGLILSADCADLYSPKVLRGAMGGVFRLPLYVVPKLETLVVEFRAMGIQVCAAALNAQAVPVQSACLGDGCAVLIGNEGNGLPQELIALCDKSVIIPMNQATESLNAGVAAGILLWELYKNR